MARRRVRVASVLSALLAVVVGFALFVQSRSQRLGYGITPEAVAAIRQGMTYAEVEELMGCPPGQYGPPTSYWYPPICWGEGYREEWWGGRRAGVRVIFDPVTGGQVVRAIPSQVFDRPSDFRRRLRQALGRFWPW